jgi:CHAT domain-containing protein
VDGPWRPVESLDDLEPRLSQCLIEPLAEVIGAKRRWIISPDGPLSRLPFEMLRLKGRYVSERHVIHYTQSLSLFALSAERKLAFGARPRDRSILAVGNPLYEEPEDPMWPSGEDGGEASAPRYLLQTSTRLLWRPLPGTEKEVKGLQAIFRRVDLLTGEAAREARLAEMGRSGALKRYRYLHLAVHGLLAPVDAMQSSVVLSQVRLKPGTDGYITAAEWPSYELQADLVTLSACESGLGKVVAGEGVIGLPYALFVAGAANVLVSLWQVNDESTAEFMLGFYRYVKAGHPLADALAYAKRDFMRHPRFSHPRYWAAFVLIGAG